MITAPSSRLLEGPGFLFVVVVVLIFTISFLLAFILSFFLSFVHFFPLISCNFTFYFVFYSLPFVFTNEVIVTFFSFIPFYIFFYFFIVVVGVTAISDFTKGSFFLSSFVSAIP